MDEEIRLARIRRGRKATEFMLQLGFTKTWIDLESRIDLGKISRLTPKPDVEGNRIADEYLDLDSFSESDATKLENAVPTALAARITSLFSPAEIELFIKKLPPMIGLVPMDTCIQQKDQSTESLNKNWSMEGFVNLVRALLRLPLMSLSNGAEGLTFLAGDGVDIGEEEVVIIIVPKSAHNTALAPNDHLKLRIHEVSHVLQRATYKVNAAKELLKRYNQQLDEFAPEPEERQDRHSDW